MSAIQSLDMNESPEVQTESVARAGNPFATRHVRPGAIAFIFPANVDGQLLIDRWRAAKRRGAILGPHGSGKSTLLASLATQLEEAGECIVRVNLHDGERRLPASLHQRCAEVAPTLLIVDGYEQLSWFGRRQLRRLCLLHSAGLLVTAHGDVRLPVIFRPCVNDRLVQEIVVRLSDGCSGVISAEDVLGAWRLHGDNVREALFSLYDLHEQRARTAGFRS